MCSLSNQGVATYYAARHAVLLDQAFRRPTTPEKPTEKKMFLVDVSKGALLFYSYSSFHHFPNLSELHPYIAEQRKRVGKTAPTQVRSP